MTETSLNFPEAARHLGVALRVLRAAIRAGKIPAPAQNTATAILSADWLASAAAAVKASPTVLNRVSRQKVLPFARYKGTSAWRKYSRRVRDYNQFRTSVG